METIKKPSQHKNYMPSPASRRENATGRQFVTQIEPSIAYIFSIGLEGLFFIMKLTTILSVLMGMSTVVSALPFDTLYGVPSIRTYILLHLKSTEHFLTKLNVSEPFQKRSPQKKIDAVDVEKRSPQKKIDAVDVEKRQKKIDAVDVEKRQKKIDAVDVEKRQKKIDAVDVEKRSPQKKIDAVDVEKRQKKIDAVDVEKRQKKIDAVDVEKRQKKIDAVDVE